MVSDFSANTFAAGDNGLHASGSFEKAHATSANTGFVHRLASRRVALLTLLPNGRLQRIYGTETQLVPTALADGPECELCWRVLASGKAAYQSIQKTSMLAVPFSDPLLPGYPGVAVFFRSDDEPAFAAKDLDPSVDEAHQFRRALGASAPAERSCAVIMIDSKFRSLLSACGLTSFDPQIRSALLDDAKSRLGKRPRRTATRVRLRDRRGIVHNFRVEQLKNNAIGDGAVLAYTRVPSITEWAHVDEAAFENTPEIARLIPALKYMIAKFASLPGLTQIAAKAKLSPYHFHREFSSLLGISPKHLMLDCQIESAGRQLARGDVDLVDIARSCGFAHQSHFTSRFKQASGLTPTAWRRAVRTQAD